MSSLSKRGLYECPVLTQTKLLSEVNINILRAVILP